MDDRTPVDGHDRRPCGGIGSRVAIVGAGVGGLAAAIGLARVGCRPTVFERSDAVRAGGGALWIFPNGVHALRSLGLGRELPSFATPVHSYQFWDWSGRRLWSMPVDSFPARYGAPLVIVERGQLLSFLLRHATARAQIQVEAECSGFTVAGSRVRPRFVRRIGSEPSSACFDALIGADGFGSVIRSQLVGDRATEPLQMAWTGTAVLDRSQWFCSVGEMASFHGRGLLFTVSTARPRTDDPANSVRVLWFASERRSSEQSKLTHDELSSLFGQADARIGQLVERTRDPVAYPVRDRDPLRRWSRGRVTLLGDAAHPMTPDLGQGACQALEDAVTLAAAMRPLGSQVDRPRAVERALERYQGQRVARSGRVVRMSRLMSMSRLAFGTPWDGVRNLLTAGGVPSFLMHELRFVLGGEPVSWLWPSPGALVTHLPVPGNRVDEGF